MDDRRRRSLALGINGVALISGSFLGLLIGGLVAPIEWRLVFLVCVPFGLFGTVWAYLERLPLDGASSAPRGSAGPR